MQQTLLLVPPDTRPPTFDFPVKLARAVGLRVFTPPKEALNDLNQPGNHEALKDWLLEHVHQAQIMILSLEQLTLGGMIPARRLDDSLEQALERLELLRDIKRINPGLRILAFGVIVRVAHGNDPLEEKPYYGEYGDYLRAYSEAFDRFERQHNAETERHLWQATKPIPAPILENWLSTRQRNHQIHLKAMKFVQEGVLEHLCLTLDDTSTFGLASHDRRKLEQKTDDLRLWHKVNIYPGADEVPVTLLVRALQEHPSKVYVRYSSLNGAKAGMKYEDRTAGELIKAHLRAAKCTQADILSEADLVLAVNTPAITQTEDRPDYLNVDTAERHLPEFVDFIAHCLQQNKPLSIADIAYPNGAEERFIRLLETLAIARLSGFSGWNTAGNSLGSSIAMGVLSQKVQHHRLWTEILFNRFVDDYLYQTLVRPQVHEQNQHLNHYDLGEHKIKLETLVNQKIETLALEFWQKHFANAGRLQWKPSYLAWPRLFTGVFPFEVS
jgi:hypothetical protein